MYLSFLSVDGRWRIRSSGVFYPLSHRQTFDEQQAVTQQVKYKKVRYKTGDRKWKETGGWGNT